MQAARCPLHGRLPLRTIHGLRGVLGVPTHAKRAWGANVPPCGDAAASQRLIAARAVKPDVLQSDAVQAATAAAAAQPAWRWEESEDATKAYAVLAATLLFGLVPGLETQKWAGMEGAGFGMAVLHAASYMAVDRIAQYVKHRH